MVFTESGYDDSRQFFTFAETHTSYTDYGFTVAHSNCIAENFIA